MLSKYFEMKTVREDFKSHMKDLFKELEGKKVVIYGAGEGFEELNKRYNFKERFEVVAIADKKFETCECDVFSGFRVIQPAEIPNVEFDYVLVSNEQNKNIIYYLEGELSIPCEKILKIFTETYFEEGININLLEKFNFSKQIIKLSKKMKNKKIVIYGGGAFFQVIKNYYDLSMLNIIAVADKRFENNKGEFEGYPTITPNKIKDLNPDVVLVATKVYMSIIEELYFGILHKSKIVIKPLFKKPFMILLKEIWN